MTNELAVLADRVEGLHFAEGETDALIHIAIGLGEGNTCATPLGWCVGSRNNPNPVRAPSYTFSLDAAMTLVPEGWFLSHIGEHRNILRGPWLAQVNDGTDEPAMFSATAATPALALTAAALRSRIPTPPRIEEGEHGPCGIETGCSVCSAIARAMNDLSLLDATPPERTDNA